MYFIANTCFFVVEFTFPSLSVNVKFSVEPTVEGSIELHFSDVIVPILND